MRVTDEVRQGAVAQVVKRGYALGEVTERLNLGR